MESYKFARPNFRGLRVLLIQGDIFWSCDGYDILKEW